MVGELAGCPAAGPTRRLQSGPQQDSRLLSRPFSEAGVSRASSYSRPACRRARRRTSRRFLRPQSRRVCGSAPRADLRKSARRSVYVRDLFTFGSPRLWDSGFQKLLQRHVNHSRLYVWRDAVAERPRWYRYHAELESWQLSLHRKAKRSDPGRPGHWQVTRGWSAGNPFVEN